MMNRRDLILKGLIVPALVPTIAQARLIGQESIDYGFGPIRVAPLPTQANPTRSNQQTIGSPQPQASMTLVETQKSQIRPVPP